MKDKPEICKNDANDICKMIIQTMVEGNLVDSDPQITAIGDTLSHICVCLKDDFKPYLPMIIPQLLKDANKDIDFNMIDADDPGAGDADKEEGYASLQLKVRGLEGAKQITMNTNALEIKINAVQILKNLARNMGVHMFDFVEDIAKLCLEKLLSDKFAHTLRKESAKLMRFLIDACKEHPDKQKTLYIMTYVKLMEEIELKLKRKDFEEVNGILKELGKQIRLFVHFKEKNLTVYSVEDA